MELGEVRGSRVAIIGGSIAGCAAAVAVSGDALYFYPSSGEAESSEPE